jgi:segregation and condensation protein B
MAETGKAQILPFTPTDQSDNESGGEMRASSQSVREHVRMAEAILFASAEPVSERALRDRLPEDADIGQVLDELNQAYEGRGVNLVKIGGNWGFRTADDLGFMLSREAVEIKKLSRAALEVLAIIAYHQPVTRAEVEEIRGVATSKGTLDILLETGWVRMRGRRRVPGRPVTYGTTEAFLDHFGLEELRDLPGLDELKGAGLLQSQLPANFQVPIPDDGFELAEDEDSFGPEDLEELGLLPPSGGQDDED